MQWSFVLLITTCAISVLSSPAPPCSTNGAFFADDDCTKYWSCANGIAYEFSCPATLNFNPSSDVCDYAASAGCTGKGWDDPTEPYVDFILFYKEQPLVPTDASTPAPDTPSTATSPVAPDTPPATTSNTPPPTTTPVAPDTPSTTTTPAAPDTPSTTSTTAPHTPPSTTTPVAPDTPTTTTTLAPNTPSTTTSTTTTRPSTESSSVIPPVDPTSARPYIPCWLYWWEPCWDPHHH
ncbi:hypothetical protein HUJ05_006958 [Dendroctonus ponderosae]|nr:hypothetical protein HUJ05_006958 [Dendroctonus ponderosae]